MPQEKATFQGIMLERAVTRGHPDCWGWPLLLLHSDHAVPGPALTLLKKVDHPYPNLRHLKTHLNFLCAYPRRQPMVGLREELWENTEPGCSGEQLALGHSASQTKNVSVLSVQEFVRSCFKRTNGIYSMNTFTSDTNLPWLHQSYTALHLTQARTQPSIHMYN